MKLTPSQLARLNATHGACSIVTAREAGHDKSVTIDRHELEVLMQRINPANITHKGGGENDGLPPKHPFFNGLKTVELALKYPKRCKTELRLYMSRANMFYGKEGDVFYVYVKARSKHVTTGFMSQSAWAEFAGENHEQT